MLLIELNFERRYSFFWAFAFIAWASAKYAGERMSWIRPRFAR